MRSAISGLDLYLRRQREPDSSWRYPPLTWPALAKCYGVWGYALGRAYDEAKERQQKVYVYKGELDVRPVWVTALDPKKEDNV